MLSWIQGLVILSLCGLAYLFVAKIIPARKSHRRISSAIGFLRGPPRKGFFLGYIRQALLSPDARICYRDWTAAYGGAFRLPLLFGMDVVVFPDPKLASRVMSKDTTTYVKLPSVNAIVERVVGRGVVWSEGEDHKRQRRFLQPAFSSGTVKDMRPHLFFHTNKMKAAWLKVADNSEKVNKTGEVEIHHWLHKLSLDTIGTTSFDHDFHAIDGDELSPIEEALHLFNSAPASLLSTFVQMIETFVPMLGNIPTKRNRMFYNLGQSTRQIVDQLLAKTKKKGVDEYEKDTQGEKSAIGQLLEYELSTTGIQIEKEEVVAQLKTLLVAGSDPTSAVLAWAFIELAKKPELQQQVREEVLRLDDEPSWDVLQSSLPLLDAAIVEAVRLHPTILETLRVATEDDIIPLDPPLIDITGTAHSELIIPKGTHIIIPTNYLNCETDTWGADAMEYNPNRWMTNQSFIQSSNRIESSAVRKLIWSFGEGPRLCLGRLFALAQMKVALFVLLRAFTFELPNGPGTKIEQHLSIVQRPKVAGSEGAKFPLKIRRL